MAVAQGSPPPMSSSSSSLSLLQETEYLRLPFRSNVYGITKIASQSASPGLLVATQAADESYESKVFHVGFNHPQPPSAALALVTSAPVPFTYVPVEAEVISIDSFERKGKDNQLSPVIGLTLAKISSPTSKTHSYYFNIYGGTTTGPLDIMQISGDCQSIPISFTPFLLTHTSVELEGNLKQTVFLLCGGDNRIHLFEEDLESGLFQEQPVGKYFPELEKVHNKVLCLSIEDDGQGRVVAVGCQDGTLQLAIGPKSPSADSGSEDIWVHKVTFDGPVTSVCLFRSESRGNRDSELNPLHLLVCGSLDCACVYGAVVTQGLSSPILLPQSEMHDNVLCSLVTDLDYDGMNEIILGTYGQMLLVYQGKPSTGYELHWKRLFSYPLCSLLAADLTKDGVEEIVVLSLFGVHILQTDISSVRGKLRFLLQSLQNAPQQTQG